MGQLSRLRSNAGPELETVDGFFDTIRYRSLTRGGWILSLSGWRDEKSVVRWRTRMRHHEVQEKARSEILLDYHPRVGQLTRDPCGCPTATPCRNNDWTRRKSARRPR